MAECEGKVWASCEGEITVRFSMTAAALCAGVTSGKQTGRQNVFSVFPMMPLQRTPSFSAVLSVLVHKSYQCGQRAQYIPKFSRRVPILHTSVIKTARRVSAEMCKLCPLRKVCSNKTCCLSHPTNDADQQTCFIQMDKMSMG